MHIDLTKYANPLWLREVLDGRLNSDSAIVRACVEKATKVRRDVDKNLARMEELQKQERNLQQQLRGVQNNLLSLGGYLQGLIELMDPEAPEGAEKELRPLTDQVQELIDKLPQPPQIANKST